MSREKNNSPEAIARRAAEQFSRARANIASSVDATLVAQPHVLDQIVRGVIATSGNGDEFVRYVKQLRHPFSLEHDLYDMIPENLRAQFREELSVEDQFSLIHLLRATFEGIQERDHGEASLQNLPPHFTGDVLPRSSDAIEQFITQHASDVSISALASMCHLPDRLVTESGRIAALASCLRAQTIEETLPSIGVDSPLVVLENRRGYVSCPETETYYQTDIAQQNTGTLELELPEGRVRLLIKHSGMVMGLCEETSHPEFEVGMSYIPIGLTVEHFKAIANGTQSRISTLPNGKMVLAKNRRLSIEHLIR